MLRHRVDQCVILAAGLGSRIRGQAQPLPKPLVPVGGIPLLKRTMLTAREAGIQRFVIVVGCEGEQIRDFVLGDRELSRMEVVFVLNERYRLSNGVSVLAARPYVDGEFFLTMSDHIVEASIFHTLQGTPAPNGLVLAVDHKLETIFDMDDATKVKVAGDRIADIGKEIPAYDAVDTGVFRCGQPLFEALAAVYDKHGDCSLSHGVRALADRDQARVADVGDAWWQDVDTPETRRYAESVLARNLAAFNAPVTLRQEPPTAAPV